jgi:hypothetical protein
MKVRIKGLIAIFILAGMILVNVRTPVCNSASQTDINNAIENGLAHLNSTQASDGSWSASLHPVASTAMAVLAFENNGHYGWNMSDPYNTTVQNGLDYLFVNGQNITIGLKPAGNPDVSGTGVGIAWDFSSYPAYESPMVLMAIIASNAPTNVTSLGALGVRSYHAIAQDIVDYLAWSQNDNTTVYSGRGGWSYTPTLNFYGSDNSNTPWPILGLMAAELWGINAPAFVATELEYWIATCQSPNLGGTPLTNPNYGAFWYSAYSGGYILGGVAEAAAGILEMTYTGVPTSNANITAAEGYINRMWTTNDASWNVNIGNLYTMYSVMKAMREATPAPLQFIANYDGSNGVEWYNGTSEYADALVSNQSSDGNWTNWMTWAESGEYSPSMNTALGVLILQGGLTAPVVVKYGLTVTVLDAITSNPIVSANVTIVGPQTLSSLTTVSGQVVFGVVLAGSYVVSASKAGYTPASVNVSLTKDTDITIKLTPITLPLTVTKFFTDSSLCPLPLDSKGNPEVYVVLPGGIVRSTNPGEVLAWINVTNTAGVPLQSLQVNETLPVDWAVHPAWMPGLGAIHVYFANTTSLSTNPEITQPSTITVSTGNPQVVYLAIPSLNITAIGHPLMPGQTILLAVKLTYALKGTSQSTVSYPRNYTDTASAAAWSQPNYTGTQATGTATAFFIAYAKITDPAPRLGRSFLDIYNTYCN